MKSQYGGSEGADSQVAENGDSDNNINKNKENILFPRKAVCDHTRMPRQVVQLGLIWGRRGGVLDRRGYFSQPLCTCWTCQVRARMPLWI